MSNSIFLTLKLLCYFLKSPNDFRGQVMLNMLEIVFVSDMSVYGDIVTRQLPIEA